MRAAIHAAIDDGASSSPSGTGTGKTFVLPGPALLAGGR